MSSGSSSVARRRVDRFESIGSRTLAPFVLAIVLCAVGNVAAAPLAADIEVFTRTGCPRCTEAEQFLQALQERRPGVRIARRHVDRDPQALQRLSELAAQKGVDVIGVPAFYARDQLIIGFVSPEITGPRILALIGGNAGASATEGGVCTTDPKAPCVGAEDVERLTLPLFGPLAVRDIGLPLFTVALGLLDGLNPCAMWVLLFLLSLLVNVHDRMRMLLIAGTFVLASGLVYFAFMAAWLNVFLLVGFSATVRVILGIIAALVGLVNVKDFFAWGTGISFSIPDPAKPSIYGRARRILQAENLIGALIATIVLALLVNTVELLCTAGFPALYTHILTQRELPRWEYYGYLTLYNAAYIFDDGVMVLTSVITLRRFKLQERGGRWLKLASGAVMLALGLALLLAPEWIGT